MNSSITYPRTSADESLMSQSFEFTFFTPYAYEPRQSGNPQSAESKRWCYDLKNNRVVSVDGNLRETADLFCESLSHRLGDPDWPDTTDFFGDDVVAIPIPGSSIPTKNSIWVPELISEGLERYGLVGGVSACLQRSTPVQKSSSANPGGRPSPWEHSQTMAFTPSLKISSAKRILLVDDVLTKGSTLCGAVMCLRNHGIKAEIRGAAMIRTLGLNNFRRFRDPVVGTVTFDGWETKRIP